MASPNLNDKIRRSLPPFGRDNNGLTANDIVKIINKRARKHRTNITEVKKALEKFTPQIEINYYVDAGVKKYTKACHA